MAKRNEEAKWLAISFLTYVVTHREERFWQALRNWAGINFLYRSDKLLEEGGKAVDTFYFKGLDK